MRQWTMAVFHEQQRRQNKEAPITLMCTVGNGMTFITRIPPIGEICVLSQGPTLRGRYAAIGMVAHSTFWPTGLFLSDKYKPFLCLLHPSYDIFQPLSIELHFFLSSGFRFWILHNRRGIDLP